MKTNSAFILAIALGLCAPLLPLRAQTVVAGVPTSVDFQGTVYKNDGAPYGSTGTGPYTSAPENKTMQFKIYDGPSPSALLLWAETQTVTVNLGSFAVRLGSGAQIGATPFGAAIADIFAKTKSPYLELTVVTGTTAIPILPRLAFQSSPFAFVAQRAKKADEVTSGTISGGTLTGTISATGSTISGGTYTGGTYTGGTFNGDGSSLTNLSANNLTGSILDARLSSNVALLNRSTQVFTGSINSFTGNVGIGTTTPTQAKLVVRGSVSGSAAGDRGFFAGTSPYLGGTQTTYRVRVLQADQTTLLNTELDYSYPNESEDVIQHPVTSIYADKAIWSGTQLVTSSDERIKNIRGRSDTLKDLNTLVGIEITDYRYKDFIGQGSAVQKKVIAQQVEKVFPQAVSRQTNVVPDIYTLASIKDGWVSLATDLKKGERVKLIAEDNEESIHEVLEVKKDKFRTDFKPAGVKVFVYGREVNDFRTVDYDAIAMLNVSATQQLKKDQDAQIRVRDEKIAALEERLAVLEEQSKRLADLEAKDQVRDAKLAAIEKLLSASDQAALRTISLQAADVAQ